MKSRDADPRRLDVAALAEAAGHLEGEWALATFERLKDLQAVPAPDGRAGWSADGELRAPLAAARTPAGGHRQPAGARARGDDRVDAPGARQVWLHLQGQVRLVLQCQRCLEGLPTTVRVDRRFLFVRDEDEAARLDEELEDDVLVLSRELDLHALLEDELLLAMPLVPMHEACAAPLAGPDTLPSPRSPFEALAALRSGGSS